jgi:hypothetical protein
VVTMSIPCSSSSFAAASMIRFLVVSRSFT